MRFERCHYVKSIEFCPTPAKRRAAARAIERQKQKDGMFPSKESLETVDDRLMKAHQIRSDFNQKMRRHRAETLMKVRKVTAELKRDGRRGLIDEFFGGGWPKDPTYFLDFVRTKLGR